jgi:DNA polymerase IV
LHVDLDAFYASVEQRDNPHLRGRPVLVGGPAPRGVVAAASYQARAFGVHSAMPMAQALKLCPQAVVVAMGLERYADASRQFFAILGDFSPTVESLSLDEAFIDVHGMHRLLGSPRAIAELIKRRVARELELVASVGAAPTKFVAKIASDIEKPDGLCVVEPDQVLAFLHRLPVSRLWGVGRVTQARLDEMGLTTIGALARYPEELLRKRLGAGLGAHLAALARGEDARPVVADRASVTIGHEETFPLDLDDPAELTPTLLQQADRVAARLRRARLRARVVLLKIKYANFRTVSRRLTLRDATSDGSVIGRAALELLQRVDIGPGQGRAVRLCGVAAANLIDRDGRDQLTLCERDRQRGERLGDVLDQIHDRFGTAAVIRAVHAHPGPIASRAGKVDPDESGSPPS